jgi:hypothetical protein
VRRGGGDDDLRGRIEAGGPFVFSRCRAEHGPILFYFFCDVRTSTEYCLDLWEVEISNQAGLRVLHVLMLETFQSSRLEA